MSTTEQPTEKTTLRLPGRAGVTGAEALANLTRLAHANDAETLMRECMGHEAKQREEIARTPIGKVGEIIAPRPSLPAHPPLWIGENGEQIDPMEFPRIVRELNFSIGATTCSFDETTTTHTTDGTFTLAVDERAYSETQGRRTPLPQGNRNIAWEPTHPTYESALQSAIMQLANYRASK